MSVEHIAAEAAKYFFQKRFPYRSQYDHTPEEREAIRKKYAKWQWITGIMMLVFLCGLPMVYSVGLDAVYQPLAQLVVRPPYALYTPGYYAFIPAAILFMFSTFFYPIQWLQRYFMGMDGYALYIDHSSAKEQYDIIRSLTWISKLFRIPSAIALLLACSTGIITSSHGLTVRGLFELPHSYGYGQVKGITYYSYYREKKGKEVYAPRYIVMLDDGMSISTNWYFTDLNAALPFIASLGKKADTVRMYLE